MYLEVKDVTNKYGTSTYVNGINSEEIIIFRRFVICAEN